MPEANTLYEAMYIINASLTPEEVEQVVGRIENHITENGGELVGTRDFGRRHLAYKIGHQSEGIYKITYFRGTGAVVDEVKHEFLLTETIVRGTVFLANPDCYVNEYNDLVMPTTGTRRGGLTAEDIAAAAAEEAAAAAAEAAPAEEPAIEEAAPAEEAPEAAAAEEAADVAAPVEEVAEVAPVAEPVEAAVEVAAPAEETAVAAVEEPVAEVAAEIAPVEEPAEAPVVEEPAAVAEVPAEPGEEPKTEDEAGAA